MVLAPVRAYHAPSSVRECIEILGAEPGRAMLLAGGQSALPLLKSRQLRPEVLLDLAAVSQLRDLTTPSEGESPLELGSMVRYRDIVDSPVIFKRWAALGDAASNIGDLQVRNRGTVGGNLVFADVAADMPPVAVCLSAELLVVGPHSERTVPAAEFFAGPRRTTLGSDEILTGLRFPAPSTRTASAYIKYGITANGRPVIGVAAVIALDEEGTCTQARVVVGGVLPSPHRALNAENLLVGAQPRDEVLIAAADAAAAEVPTQDDDRGSASYRRQLINVYTERVLRRAAERVQKGESL